MFEAKLKAFAERLTQEHLSQLTKDGVDCQPNRDNCKTDIIPGRKYTKVNIGHSGKYMVENSTGVIFGIKGYGQVHLGHSYGTLDTIDEWYWGSFYARRKT